MKMQGCFISFEGGEGAGKTTQIKALAEFLRAQGREVVLTREPGGSAAAEQIRKLLVQGEPGSLLPQSEALLLYAARFDHVERLIKPALAAGKIILSDRFADSSFAYQGYGHGLPLSWLEQLHKMVLADFKPHLTLVLDIAAKAGLARDFGQKGAETRFEQMSVDFHERLRQGFLALAKAEPQRCHVIDATAALAEVTHNVQQIVTRFLAQQAAV